MWTSINKKLYFLISTFLVVGIVLGIVFVLMQDEATKEILFLNINESIQKFSAYKINLMGIHLMTLSSLLVLSIFIIGGPLIIFFLFYNGFTIGFIICNLTLIFGIKGLLYALIYIIITRGVYLVLINLLITKLFKIIKNVINKVIKKEKNNNLVFYIEQSLIIIGIIFINDIILYFLGNKLMNLFHFLLI